MTANAAFVALKSRSTVLVNIVVVSFLQFFCCVVGGGICARSLASEQALSRSVRPRTLVSASLIAMSGLSQVRARNCIVYLFFFLHRCCCACCCACWRAIFECAIFECVFECAIFECAIFECAICECVIFECAIFECAIFECAIFEAKSNCFGYRMI
jgi:hypothetical protein